MISGGQIEFGTGCNGIFPILDQLCSVLKEGSVGGGITQVNLIPLKPQIAMDSADIGIA